MLLLLLGAGVQAPQVQTYRMVVARERTPVTEARERSATVEAQKQK